MILCLAGGGACERKSLRDRFLLETLLEEKREQCAETKRTWSQTNCLQNLVVSKIPVRVCKQLSFFIACPVVKYKTNI